MTVRNILVTARCDALTQATKAAGPVLASHDTVYAIVSSPQYAGAKAFKLPEDAPQGPGSWTFTASSSLTLVSTNGGAAILNANVAAGAPADLTFAFVEDHGDALTWVLAGVQVVSTAVGAIVPGVGGVVARVIGQVENVFLPGGYFGRQSLGIFGFEVAEDANGQLAAPKPTTGQNAAVVPAQPGDPASSFRVSLTGDQASYTLLVEVR